MEYSFPEDLDSDEAVTISSGEHTISIKHLEISKNSKSQKKQKKSASKIKKTTDKYMEALPLTDEIVYNNTDENTNLEYEVGSLGIKENIVLTKKPNKHLQYKYFIASDTLQAVLNKDSSISFYVGDGTNEDDIIFYIPAPYMFDSNNVESYNILTTLDKTKDGYILTYKPDSEWLRDKSRVYPVTIDPTVNATDTVISAYTCSGGGYNDYVLSWEQQLKVGYDRFMSPTGYHETYVRFPFLPTIPSGCTVTSAYISLCRRGGSSTSITIGTYKVLHDWNPGTLTYDTRPSCDENMISSRLCSGNSGEYYDWYITDTVLEWYQKRNTYGIRFSSLYSDDFISFHSTRSTYTNMVPKLTINYTHSDDLDSDNLSGATNMNSVGNRTTITRNLDHSNDTDCFKFTPTSSGNYDIFTTSNIDTVGVLYSGTAANSKIADNDDPSGFTFADFAITANLTAGHTYYVEVFSSNSDTGTFTLTVAKRDDHSNASGLATSVNLGISKSGTINYNGDEDWFVFNCTNGGFYNFYTSGNLDTVGTLYQLENNSLNQLTQDNNGDKNDNFRIGYHLTSNTQYYIKIQHINNGTGSYNFMVAVGITDGGVYYIKNKKSGMFLDVSGGLDKNGQNVQQYSSNSSSSQRWTAIYESDGNYRFLPAVSRSRYLQVVTESSNNGVNIVINENNDSYRMQLWYPQYNANGTFTLFSYCSDYTKCMATEGGSTLSGANVYQYAYQNNQSDQWEFTKLQNNDFGYGHVSINNTKYPIYVSSDSPTIGAVYTTYQTISYYDQDIDIPKFFAGYLSADRTMHTPIIVNGVDISLTQKPSFALSQVFRGLGTAFTSSINNLRIDYNLQKSGLDRRVVINTYSSETTDLLNMFADGITRSSYYNCSEADLVFQENKIRSIYKSIYGGTADKTYDILMTVDPNHKKSNFISTIWINSQNQIMEKPNILPKDKFVIGTCGYRGSGFEMIDDITPSASYPLSADFQNLFSREINN